RLGGGRGPHVRPPRGDRPRPRARPAAGRGGGREPDPVRRRRPGDAGGPVRARLQEPQQPVHRDGAAGPGARDVPARHGDGPRRKGDPMTKTSPDAMLVLEDGTTLRGKGFGAYGETFGEMVFNTGMTGYQETLTDPSYCGQIVAMTAPHIGNTGTNDEDPESRRIWVSGYVIREPARVFSSWRAQRSLEDELRAHGITGIAITGTRALTLHLRERGAMQAAISTR